MREKIVADGSKSVGALGNGPLPVEGEPFCWEAALDALAALGCEPKLRVVKTQPFATDVGHYAVDCLLPGIPDPAALETEIKRGPGALECDLFVGLARAAVIARGRTEGGTEIIEEGVER